MKKVIITLVAVLCSAVATFAQVDKMVGEWRTVDDKTNQPVSVVNIYKADNGLYYGKLVQLLVADEDQSIIGTMIVKDMKAKDGKLSGGKVFDPESGNTYYCTIKYDAKKDALILRGSLDKAGLLGRTQTWIR